MAMGSLAALPAALGVSAARGNITKIRDVVRTHELNLNNLTHRATDNLACRRIASSRKASFLQDHVRFASKPTPKN